MTREEFWKNLMGPEEPSLAREIDQTHYDAIIETDLDTGVFRYVFRLENKYADAAFTRSFEGLFDFAAEHLVHSEDAAAYRAMLEPSTMRARLAAGSGMQCGDFRLRGIEGGWVRTRHILIAGGELGLSEDVARCYVYDLDWDQKSRAAAAREEVTGLLDGNEYFRAAQPELEDMPPGWCLMHIKIDHHKLFTDWYGLKAGQSLLARVSELLKREAAETNGLPGYLGEEDFVLTGPYDTERIERLRLEIQAVISSISEMDGFRPLIGIALFDGSCHDIREYFNHAALTAEELMADAIASVRVYDAEQHKKNSLEYRILYDFRDAMRRGEITFWLQPQCELPNRKIIGAEALARWIKPGGEMIPPGVFVPILERHGKITQLDTCIWEAVGQWLHDWKARGKPTVPISVNVSQVDLYAMDVPAFFADLIRRQELEVRDIKIEITESAYAEDADTVRAVVRRLRETGFLVMMDDFGSGYSSLNMLSSLNMDVIKLDAHFISREGSDFKNVSILESVINMSRSLSTPVIVEGVETRDQMQYLSDLGCRYVQGFYFYRPMPVERFCELLSDAGQIDARGIVPKTNQQIRVRELYDANLFSDVMLNNLIGPIVMYCWHGEDIDIFRYNEQFYRLVGIEIQDFNERVLRIQQYIHPEDRESMYALLRTAQKHPVLGARGVIRTFRPNGILTALSLQIYFMNEDKDGKKFYASATDVSELQFINTDLPGGYFRCLLEDSDFEFIYVSQNFLDMTGYTEAELRYEFDNKFGRMIHPADIRRVRKESTERAQGRRKEIRSYRIRRKRGDYIYVSDQSHITDRFGAPCWQNVIIDVTRLMHNHNQMRVLSDLSDETVLFLCRDVDGLVFEVGINGLGNVLGLDVWQLERALNGGGFFSSVEGPGGSDPRRERLRQFIESTVDAPKVVPAELPNGKTVMLSVDSRSVSDDSRIEYIVKLLLA